MAGVVEKIKKKAADVVQEHEKQHKIAEESLFGFCEKFNNVLKVVKLDVDLPVHGEESNSQPLGEVSTRHTLLTSNPRDKVDGVEIGNEFTKVIANHPLKEDDEFVQKING
ncbi:hypothetical protein E2562_018631 [Oryza meyeriana var. granulata]|uniref:Uncharacterized protein n=1 Tax=Oryza meyeriana var. granulata TaxID=110450 RepID=A0A6G1BY10_9ORYZ|nr:hypothetical protein E2562_018631 [Oryza meyeriana var. granulata]